MKAAVYNPYWETLGGGERYTGTVIEYLLRRGWQVDVNWKSDLGLVLKDRFGLNIAGAKYIDNIDSHNYDLLFWVSDGSLPASFARQTIIHFQFPFRNVGGSRWFNYLKSRFYKFVVNSEFTKGFIDREYGVNSNVIYPPINTNDFKPGKKEKSILYVGRFSNLTQTKGQNILIEAFKKLNLKDWKLVLAGGTNVGTENLEQLKRQARGYLIEFVTNPGLEQLQKLFASSSIFWSASGFGEDENKNPMKVEHFGITVVEAMAAGCVPLVTNLGGHKEIVSERWDTVDQLIGMTKKIINDPKQMALLSKLVVKKSKMFNIQRFYEAFDNVVDNRNFS